MSDENNKPEDELDEDQIEDELDDETDESDDNEDEDSAEDEGIDLTGLTGAALTAALAANKKRAAKSKKPVKGKSTRTAKAKSTKAVKSKIPEGTVDVNAEIEKLQNLTDKNTVWTVAGYSFTPAKLMILGTILSTALGGLYGSFEVYKDYQDMKMKIAKYVAPDLSEIYKKVEIAEQNSEKTVQYTQDIKNDLKQDIRRLEGVVDTVERTSKATERELTVDMRSLRKETEVAIRETNANVDKKIQRALDNPLSK